MIRTLTSFPHGALAGSMAATTTVALLYTLGLPPGTRSFTKEPQRPALERHYPENGGSPCGAKVGTTPGIKAGTERDMQASTVSIMGTGHETLIQEESGKPDRQDDQALVGAYSSSSPDEAMAGTSVGPPPMDNRAIKNCCKG